MRLLIVISFLLAAPRLAGGSSRGREFASGSQRRFARNKNLSADNSYAAPLNPSTGASFAWKCPALQDRSRFRALRCAVSM